MGVRGGLKQTVWIVYNGMNCFGVVGFVNLALIGLAAMLALRLGLMRLQLMVALVWVGLGFWRRFGLGWRESWS